MTIIPRGRALGVTQFLPEQDRYSLSRRRIQSSIATLFGGRIAEELIFGQDAVTTGASNDIERATDLARNMVTKWGCRTSSDRSPIRKRRARCSWAAVSPSTSRSRTVRRNAIDEEIRNVIETTTSGPSRSW